jgi:3-(3-hydroxy-phenyl)propionate hydroxylase
MMPTEERVFIVGPGPVGLAAAAPRACAHGVEGAPALSRESRASTFHPSTLDMLDDLGLVDALIATGLVAPPVQYRTRHDGVMGIRFAGIADVTRHPYRLQSEQNNLTRIIEGKLKSDPNYRIEFVRRVCGARQVADGARSEVRKAFDIAFEGSTWPERFLVIGTTFEVYALVPGLNASDPEQWHFYLQIPGLWRMMFPIAPDVSDETATSCAFARQTLATVQPGAHDEDVAHVTLYRVHQRVAKTFRADPEQAQPGNRRPRPSRRASAPPLWTPATRQIRLRSGVPLFFRRSDGSPAAHGGNISLCAALKSACEHRNP